MVPSSQVNAQAALGFTRLSTAAGNAGKLNNDAALTARVRAIGAALIGQVGAFRADARDWGWEINVFDASTLNAFCAPGGKIGVFSGLITRLDLTDGELAAVMSHEIAHALREHSREKVSQGTLSNAIVQGILASGSRSAPAVGALASVGSQLFLRLPFSREMELEADVMGLELMARAGYDSREAPNVWRKMMAAGATGRNEFSSTHPTPENRIALLEQAAPRVLPLFEAAKPAR